MFEKTCLAWADCRAESERLQEAINERLASSAEKKSRADPSMGGSEALRSYHLDRLTNGSRARGRLSSPASDAGSVRVVDELIPV